MKKPKTEPTWTDFIVSWKGLQIAAISAYSLLTIALIFHGFRTGEWSPVLVVSVFSLLTMIARTIWTKHHGLWGKKYSWEVRKKHLALWAPAFLPERTVAVALVLIGYLALAKPENSAVVSTVFGLLITGGLVSAVITSPHNLIDVKETLDKAQQLEDN